MMEIGLLVLLVSLLVSRTTLGSCKWAVHCSELECNIPAAKLSGPKECPSIQMFLRQLCIFAAAQKD